jgi:Amt family ammonium transporter
VGSLAVTVYCAALTWGILRVVDLFLSVRATDEEEMTGLDLTDHNEKGYDYGEIRI